LTFNILNGKCCLSRNVWTFIIWIANSFMDSRIAKFSVCLFRSVFRKIFNTSSQIRIFRSNRFNFKTFFPCRITVVFPSGILKRAKFGYGPNSMDRFVGLHLTHLLSHNTMIFSCRICVIYQLNGFISSSSYRITTPGNSTMFRNGKIGSESGNSSLIISSSSSESTTVIQLRVIFL
jgi:hypothetical protein